MPALFDDPKAKKNPMGKDKKYSRAIKVPQYNPSDKLPSLNSLVDTTKYRELIKNIELSDVSDEEKKFLKYAAARHIVFNYSKIADYYANTTAEMQRLMEQSALVILDMDDAIANGYVALTEKMQQLIDEERERAEKEKEARKVLKKQRELFQKKAKEEKRKYGKQEEADNTEDTEEVSE